MRIFFSQSPHQRMPTQPNAGGDRAALYTTVFSMTLLGFEPILLELTIRTLTIASPKWVTSRSLNKSMWTHQSAYFFKKFQGTRNSKNIAQVSGSAITELLVQTVVISMRCHKRAYFPRMFLREPKKTTGTSNVTPFVKISWKNTSVDEQIVSSQ